MWQFCSGISIFLLAISLTHAKAFFPVASVMTLVFAWQAILFRTHRLALAGLIAFLIASTGVTSFANGVLMLGFGDEMYYLFTVSALQLFSYSIPMSAAGYVGLAALLLLTVLRQQPILRATTAVVINWTVLLATLRLGTSGVEHLHDLLNDYQASSLWSVAAFGSISLLFRQKNNKQLTPLSSAHNAWLGMNSLAILLAGGFYFWQALERRSKGFAVLSAAILNVAILLLWSELGYADPQLYMIPVGITILVLVEVLKREIPAVWHNPLRYAGALTILVSPTFHIVCQARFRAEADVPATRRHANDGTRQTTRADGQTPQRGSRPRRQNPPGETEADVAARAAGVCRNCEDLFRLTVLTRLESCHPEYVISPAMFTPRALATCLSRVRLAEQ